MAKRKADNGHPDAHTPGGGGAIAPSLGSDAPAAPMSGADPADLLDGSPDLAPVDVLELIAEPSLLPRRARGRPQGATNRKNADMIKLLAAKGHRDPWETLSLIQSADFNQLCRMIGADTAKMKVQVLNIQRGAAEALMNYHHSKKPQQLDLPVGDKRPLIAIGEMNVTQIGNGEGFMSAGIMPAEKPNEINGEAVRHEQGESHGNEKPNDNKAIDQ